MNPDGFDVFLSHNSSDKPSVEMLGRILKRRGIKVWLDKWELRPGLPWHSELEKIVTICKSAVVCVGGSGIGPWEEAEMEALLSRFVEERRTGNIVPIIPVLLPGAPVNPKMPVFMGIRKWVDLRDADLHGGLSPDLLEQLLWGITGERPPDTDFDEAPRKGSPALPHVKAARTVDPSSPACGETAAEPAKTDSEDVQARAAMEAIQFGASDKYELNVGGSITPNPRPDQIKKALESIESTDANPWIILSLSDRGDGVYIQAFHNGDSWSIEAQDGDIQKHFEVQEVGLEQVILLFVAFRRGGSSWKKVLGGELSELTWERSSWLTEEPEQESAQVHAELKAIRFSDADQFEFSVGGDITMNPEPTQITKALKSIKSTDAEPWISLSVDESGNEAWNGVFLDAENNDDKWQVDVRSGDFEKHFEVAEEVGVEHVILLCLAFRGGESSWQNALDGDLSHLTWRRPENP